MTYRPGNHWGVTIVRSGGESPERADGDELVAVVVNGDTGIAQRICDLLNAEDPPASHGEFSLLNEAEHRAARAERLARGAARRQPLFTHPDDRIRREEP